MSTLGAAPLPSPVPQVPGLGAISLGKVPGPPKEICGIPVEFSDLIKENEQSTIRITFTIGSEKIVRYASMASKDGKDLDYLIDQAVKIHHVFIDHIMTKAAADPTKQAEALVAAFKEGHKFTRTASGEIRHEGKTGAKVMDQGDVIGHIKGSSVLNTSGEITSDTLKLYEGMIKSHIERLKPSTPPAKPGEPAAAAKPADAPASKSGHDEVSAEPLSSSSKPAEAPHPASIPNSDSPAPDKANIHPASLAAKSKPLPPTRNAPPRPEKPSSKSPEPSAAPSTPSSDAAKANEPLKYSKPPLPKEPPPAPASSSGSGASPKPAEAAKSVQPAEVSPTSGKASTAPEATLTKEAELQIESLIRDFGQVGANKVNNAYDPLNQTNVDNARMSGGKYKKLIEKAFIGFKYITSPFINDYQSVISINRKYMTDESVQHFWESIKDRLLDDNDLIDGNISIAEALRKIVDNEALFTTIFMAHVNRKETSPEEQQKYMGELKELIDIKIKISPSTKQTEITAIMRARAKMDNAKNYVLRKNGKGHLAGVLKKLEFSICGRPERETEAKIRQELTKLFQRFPDYKTDPEFAKNLPDTLALIKEENNHLLQREAIAIRNQGRRLLYNPITATRAVRAAKKGTKTGKIKLKTSEVLKFLHKRAVIPEDELSKKQTEFNRRVNYAGAALLHKIEQKL